MCTRPERSRTASTTRRQVRRSRSRSAHHHCRRVVAGLGGGRPGLELLKRRGGRGLSGQFDDECANSFVGAISHLEAFSSGGPRLGEVAAHGAFGDSSSSAAAPGRGRPSRTGRRRRADGHLGDRWRPALWRTCARSTRSTRRSVSPELVVVARTTIDRAALSTLRYKYARRLDTLGHWGEARARITATERTSGASLGDKGRREGDELIRVLS